VIGGGEGENWGNGGAGDYGVDYGFDCWQGTKEGRNRKGEGGGTGLVLIIEFAGKLVVMEL
jgi:hypothetical protein